MLPTIGDRASPVAATRVSKSLPSHITAAPLSPSFAVVLNNVSSHFLIPLPDSSLICTVPTRWLITLDTIIIRYYITTQMFKNQQTCWRTSVGWTFCHRNNNAQNTTRPAIHMVILIQLTQTQNAMQYAKQYTYWTSKLQYMHTRTGLLVSQWASEAAEQFSLLCFTQQAGCTQRTQFSSGTSQICTKSFVNIYLYWHCIWQWMFMGLHRWDNCRGLRRKIRNKCEFTMD